MIERRATTQADWPETEALREALSRGDRQIARVGPILEHLLSENDQSLFTDEIVARVRGMLRSLGQQLLRAQAEATGQRGQDSFASAHVDELVERFFGHRELVAHCHAITLEWQLAERLHDRHALDPVLSPMFRQLVGDENSDIASASMAALAAQTRFAQSQRRMELQAGELPAELFHQVLLLWRAFNTDASDDAITRAELRLRSGYDEGAGRRALLARVVAGLGPQAHGALSVDHAGAALFLTALAARSGQTREQATWSVSGQHVARLLLGLRAAGLKPAEAQAQALKIDPRSETFGGLDELGTREAAQWLSDMAGGD